MIERLSLRHTSREASKILERRSSINAKLCWRGVLLWITSSGFLEDAHSCRSSAAVSHRAATAGLAQPRLTDPPN